MSFRDDLNFRKDDDERFNEENRFQGPGSARQNQFDREGMDDEDVNAESDASTTPFNEADNQNTADRTQYGPYDYHEGMLNNEQDQTTGTWNDVNGDVSNQGARGAQDDFSAARSDYSNSTEHSWGDRVGDETRDFTDRAGDKINQWTNEAREGLNNLGDDLSGRGSDATNEYRQGSGSAGSDWNSGTGMSQGSTGMSQGSEYDRSNTGMGRSQDKDWTDRAGDKINEWTNDAREGLSNLGDDLTGRGSDATNEYRQGSEYDRSNTGMGRSQDKDWTDRAGDKINEWTNDAREGLSNLGDDLTGRDSDATNEYRQGSGTAGSDWNSGTGMSQGSDYNSGAGRNSDSDWSDRSGAVGDAGIGTAGTAGMAAGTTGFVSDRNTAGSSYSAGNVDNDDLIDKLNDLIEICNDGNFGYKTAADNVEDSSLKSLFMKYATQRQQFVSELKSCVRQLGGETTEGGDWQGALHRTWINIKNAISVREDRAMLEECVTGEEAAVRSYRDALDDDYMVEPARSIVQRQCLAIEEALQTIRAHRDRIQS